MRYDQGGQYYDIWHENLDVNYQRFIRDKVEKESRDLKAAVWCLCCVVAMFIIGLIAVANNFTNLNDSYGKTPKTSKN